MLTILDYLQIKLYGCCDSNIHSLVTWAVFTLYVKSKGTICHNPIVKKIFSYDGEGKS